MKQPAIFLVRLCISGMLLAAIAWAQTGDDWRIDTFAGLPELGDNGPAIESRLVHPRGVAVDGAGNVYIADQSNRRIRKVDSSGVITTIAGTGERGFGGDGGPAVEAQLRSPTGVAVDGAGNVYIADQSNRRIRKVDSSGVITTIAGTGERGVGGDDGPAVEAQLRAPTGVAVDSAGNVYIADQSNPRIRKVDSSGIITTIAGTGEFGFSGDGGPAVEAQLIAPYGVAVDSAGNVYIADRSNPRIRKVDSLGVITTIAGTGERGIGGDGGPAIEAQLMPSNGAAVDGAGNVYIADRSNPRIRKVNSSGVITTIAGNGVVGDSGPAVEAQLGSPRGVAVDSAGNVYIADLSNYRIRKVDSLGVITTIAGTGVQEFGGDGGPAVEAQLRSPYGVAVDGAGNVYIADQSNHRIRKVDSSGIITTIAGTGAGQRFSGDGGPATAARLASPRGVAVDGAGNVYIADSNNQRIRKVDSSGIITTIAGTEEQGFGGDGGPAVEAQLGSPRGVAVDGAGNVYIADQSNHRIRKLTPPMTGPVATVPVVPGGSESFSISAVTPYSLTVEWTEPENTGSAITDYDVRYREVGSGGDFTDARHEGTARTATLTGLSPGTAYEVQVRATNATGTGPWSELGEVRTSPQQRGDHIYYFPHLAVGASWQTTITYINYSPQEVSCQTEFLSDHGSPLIVSFAGLGRVVSRSDVLPPGGSVHQETTSTAPIVSLALNFEADPVFSSLPPGELDVSAQGPTTYYFPHLAVGASWQTTITYINYSPQEVSCQTDFISDHGSPLLVSFAGLGTVDSRSDVLPPGGSVHQETNVELSAPLAPGWALATCSGPVKASLLFRQFKGGVAVAEAGVNAAAVPATRFVTFAEQGEGKFGTGVAYANPSDTAAHVTFTARDADGQTLASVDRALLPNGHDAQGMASLFGLTSFAGSLEVTSTVPIVSLALNFEADPVLSSLPPGEIVDSPDIPADEAAFNNLFVGKRVETNFPTVYVDFVSPGRFRETRGADISTGSYTYRKTGPHTGTLTFNYDDGDRCTVSLTFDSTTTGTATSTCVDGSSVEYDWRLVEIPSDGGQTPIIRSSFPAVPVFILIPTEPSAPTTTPKSPTLA